MQQRPWLNSGEEFARGGLGFPARVMELRLLLCGAHQQLHGCGHRDMLVSPCGGDTAPCVPLPAVLLTQSQLGEGTGMGSRNKDRDGPTLADGSFSKRRLRGVVGTPLRDGRGGRMGELAQGSGSRHQSRDLVLHWGQTATKGFDLRLPGSVHISRRSGRL